ncbi:Abi-alpha family protein [Nocardioides perillae]|uniref:DUF4393 domain-containing protein n=1 Tax=Nocardioides perillae TaxID=1119534 RepID=A0A7Y9RV52_9ACTN|nr:Abi-alpha family protein [Nocardioides perillae]NYG54515.1 hypothetical protein [Nocardioides perillae]
MAAAPRDPGPGRTPGPPGPSAPAGPAPRAARPARPSREAETGGPDAHRGADDFLGADPAHDPYLDPTAPLARDRALGLGAGTAPGGAARDRATSGGREADLAAAVEALPGLARIAASTWWHTTGWGLRTSVKATRRVARAVTDADEAAALAHDVSDTAHAVADLAKAVSGGVPVPRAVLDLAADLASDLGADLGTALDGTRAGRPGRTTGAGRGGRTGARVTRARGGSAADAVVPGDVVGGPEQGSGAGLVGGVRGSTPADGHGAAHPRRPGGRPALPADPAAELRRRGAELLERSRDVWDTSTGHPAHGRILSELAPDEARILLLLLREGPQPSVDVRTGGPVGLVSSQLVAPGLTMIGARAGCRWPEQVPSYLNNLFRLGLVWFSRESLQDPMDYQVLEAQPDVLDAVHSVRFAKVVRRSIHLTPFGEDFCRAVLVDEQDAAAARFPAHALPPEGDAAEPPSQA